MKNTIRRNNWLILLVLLLSPIVSGQLFHKKDSKDKKEKRDFNPLDNKYSVRKTGPYIGVEQGTFTNFVFGGERQWKQVKLLHARTQAVFMEANYNFKYNVMGAQAGYWYKGGRVNLIYGARISWRTDYIHNRFGIAPTIGYKFLQADLQLGYHFMPPGSNFTNVNTFFASIKYVLINDRKIKRKN